jgi:hypothetical protein
MNYIKKRYLLLLMLLAGTSALKAQEKVLTLEQAIDVALKKQL